MMMLTFSDTHDFYQQKFKLCLPVKPLHEYACTFSFSSVWFSGSVVSNSLWPHRLQHARLPCSSPSLRACANSCLLSQSSNHLMLYCLLLPLPSIFANIRSFLMSQFFAAGGQSIGDSASASVLPMNIQDWLPLGLTDLISLQSKGLLRVFSNTTVQKHQLFDAQLSLWPNSHIYTWLLEKTWLWLYGPCWQNSVSAF